MLPVNSGGHSAYQDFVLVNLRKYYPNPDSIARSTWYIIDRFWNLDLSFTDFLGRMWDSDDNHLSPHLHPLKTKDKKPKTKEAKADPVEKIKVEQLLPELENTIFDIKGQPYGSLFTLYQKEFLDRSVSKGLINPKSLALAGEETPVVTSHRERKHRICDCASKGIADCKCDRFFSQPDCDIGWNSSRDFWYHSYDLYMLVASDSESDLPVFPLLNPASKHDSHGFLHTFFRMKSFLPDFHDAKLLLDSAHDAMPYYEYCCRANITPFIDLNGKGGIKLPYKNDFTIGNDGVPVCKEGYRMNHDGSEPAKHRMKFRCPLVSRKYGCSCEHPCPESKYGRTVHVAMKDNARLFNNPPRDSDEWKLEYHASNFAERLNKRKKLNFKLKDGRYRPTKMWYCHLHHILMLQHLDIWDLPFESAL